MKFAADRLFADPEAAARKLVALANAFEPVQVWRMSNVNRASLSEQALTDIVNDGVRAAQVINRVRAQIKKAPPRRDELEINGAIREVVELTRGEAV